MGNRENATRSTLDTKGCKRWFLFFFKFEINYLLSNNLVQDSQGHPHNTFECTLSKARLPCFVLEVAGTHFVIIVNIILLKPFGGNPRFSSKDTPRN